MKSSCVELNVLPDEILLIIFKKLNNLEVLYSFHGINQRLNNIIHGTIFTNHLSFLNWSSNKTINKFPANLILRRFRSQILPEISLKIKWLDLEPSSMKTILRAVDYPHLYGLGLHGITIQTAKCLFTDKRLSNRIFKNQITTLVISIDPDQNKWWSTMEMICNRIFTVFCNLTHLTFSDASYNNIVRLKIDLQPLKFSSSTLLVLKIRVQNITECLYLLDGRFKQLHTLQIDLNRIFCIPEEIENEVEKQAKIANLKCFVLSCGLETCYYNELVLPLLHRMANLEKLGLYLRIATDERFIDGNDLKKNILNHMSHLNQFTFHIHSYVYINDETNLSSQEDIQRTFKDFQYTKIISSVDYFPERKRGQCHVFSYPFLMEYYEDITNHFPSGLYPYVRVVSLYDEHPFEHEFFMRISQSFPFMRKLSLINCHAQNNKQFGKSMNDIQNVPVVKYSYLTELDIYTVHDDYIEEFLCDSRTYLQNNIRIIINYKSLQRVTHDFTRDSTRINCTKIKNLSFIREDFELFRDRPFCIKIR